MVNDTHIQALSGMVEQILQDDPDCFLVDIRIKPTNNIKVALDADSGVSIAKCVAVNRALYKKLEETALFPDGDFSLEVSSADVNEPLKQHRQYKKNIGRKVEVILNDGTILEGKMTEVADTEILVEETKGKNKKAELIKHRIDINNIKSTKIQIQF
ncbi:MAG: ribosome maturation factor [Gemmatimonadaceae bacterium]|nr:ribosome maturation factor [Chitinophagaceae bacterium]